MKIKQRRGEILWYEGLPECESKMTDWRIVPGWKASHIRTHKRHKSLKLLTGM